MEAFNELLGTIVGFIWDIPLVLLLIGGGLFLSILSKFLPLTQGIHAIQILRGRYDDKNDPGQINHFQALTTALAATIGVGNIGGVAVAITTGGAGAVFWMWVAAVVGMTTKFFTCTLALLYRGKDSQGNIQGGPMYYIEKGLGPKFKFLAVLFATFGLLGCLPMFQSNQLAEILQSEYQISPYIVGALVTALVAVVAFGGVERIASITSKLVPSMCIIYFVLAVLIVILQIDAVPAIFSNIFTEAFTGKAAAGGAAGVAFTTVLVTGVRRAVFSNEAGVGTAPMAHGAAKTNEPVREGLVAMLGPFIDTIIICTLTALVILSSTTQTTGDIEGVSLTAQAFGNVLGVWGKTALVIVVVLFAISTMFSYSYYGKKCFSYLFGAERAQIYSVIYLAGIFAGAIWAADTVVNLLDGAFALMAFPNMIAALLLAPRVITATKDYLARKREAGSNVF